MSNAEDVHATFCMASLHSADLSDADLRGTRLMGGDLRPPPETAQRPVVAIPGRAAGRVRTR